MNLDPEDIILLAAHVGLVRDLELGLRRGASPNLVDESGYSVMHLAALSNHPGTIELLVKHQAALDPKDDDGLTPFQLAINGVRLLCAAALAEAGCDVNVLWPNRENALHSLAREDRWVMIEELANAGCDISVRSSKGETPLRIAAERGHARSVRALLQTGAKIEEVAGLTLPPEVAATVGAWRAGLALIDAI